MQLKFNTKIIFFPASIRTIPEKSVFVGKRGNHPENGGQHTVPRKQWSGPNFWIFSINECSLLEIIQSSPYLECHSSRSDQSETRAAELFHCRLCSNFSRNPQQCRFCSGLPSFGISQRLFWGKIKAKKLKKTGCVEVKKKAQISHRILTHGGSFPCFERTPELKLFVQADSHHLSYCSRSTILFLASDGRLSQRQTNDRLEMVPACSGCRVSVCWLGQSRSRCRWRTGCRMVSSVFH